MTLPDLIASLETATNPSAATLKARLAMEQQS